jgi:hypothetical protein|nr:MAG TPA: hypothetical protein [Caudoviricetes sp.]
MWENINGELIWIDKEMGWEEDERRNSVGNDQVCACGDVRDHGRRLTAGGVAVGVAGGMIAAKAVSRIGSWLLWMAGILMLIMIFM